MKYLLDTNAVARLVGGNAAVRRQVNFHAPAEIGVSSIVAFELYFGALRSARVNHNLAIVDSLAFATLAFDEGDARSAAEIRVTLQRAGMLIGPCDILIAGQAVARDLTLVTHNTREFSRVSGLRIEDWEA